MNKFDAQLIDVGTGNLHSVYNALLKLGYIIHITSSPHDLMRTSRFVLPGVGAFGSFMEGVEKLDMYESIKEIAARGDLLLGICVGMQALFDFSEEMGHYRGMGIIPGKVIRFPDLGELKVPHTGWNQLWHKGSSNMFNDIPDGSYAYFNHSYYCLPDDERHVILETDYGINYCSAVQSENVFGVQFHPEKSQRIGQQLLTNFFSK